MRFLTLILQLIVCENSFSQSHLLELSVSHFGLLAQEKSQTVEDATSLILDSAIQSRVNWEAVYEMYAFHGQD